LNITSQKNPDENFENNYLKFEFFLLFKGAIDHCVPVVGFAPHSGRYHA
jgi:hypothetical protein